MTSIHSFTDFLQKNRILLLALLLIVIAAVPRLYHLGELGFYMDEETTAFASRAMAEGKPPQMPSGMPYHRALPHTIMNALSARVFGLNNEFSYRLPGAILGILTVPLVFLLARPYVGVTAAFVAALLLALSEWHIFTSRQARMYAPFLFFYTACVFSLLRWAQSDENRHLVISIILFILTVSFHNLGIFAAFVPLIALFIPGYSRARAYKLILFSFIGGVSAYYFGKAFINAPYQTWKMRNGIETVDTAPLNTIAGFQMPDLLFLALGIVGASLGIWLARQSIFIDPGNGNYFRLLARYTLGILAGGLAATTNIHGAILAILLLLYLHPGSLADFLESTYKSIAAIAALTALTTSMVIIDSGLLPGLKSMFTFPFQYWTLLIELTPGITFLFLATLVFLAIKSRRSIGYNPYLMVICSLFPLILVGIVKNWVPVRYVIMAYPFILISSGFLLYVTIGYVLSLFKISSIRLATIITVTIAISGILGGHCVVSAYRAATLGYGDHANAIALIFPIYPDHKNPGKFVAAHRSDSDIIIAEDILQQNWYAGKVDYWLRDFETHKQYLYETGNGELKDIYTSSVAATPEIMQSIKTTKERRLWIITSGETYHQRKYYLNDEQLRWLMTIEQDNLPVFTGKDNTSKVYCLNC